MLPNQYQALHELASHTSKDIREMNYYEKQLCNNDYIDRIVMYNHETKKYFQPKCKSYSCPKHGFIQRQRLQKAIQKWLDQFDIIRFWTFTIRKTQEYSNEEFNLQFKKVWHRFITELRRNKILTKREQKLQYVKVYELHRSGVLHIHLFSTEFIHWTKLQSLWDYAVGCHFSHVGKRGNVHTKKIPTSRQASHYISKYVTKMAIQKEIKVRSWSKSGRVSIFDKRVSKGKWSIIRKDSIEYIHLRAGEPILVEISPRVTDFSLKRVRPPPHPAIFIERFDWFLQQYLFSVPFQLRTTTETKLNQ